MRERLRRGEIDDLTKPESQTERYRELDKQFDELVEKQRENIVKDQHGPDLHARTAASS